MTTAQPQYIRWFSDIGIADLALVGGKNASLGEMLRELPTRGVRVPNGFAITARAYRHVLDQADAWPALQQALSGLDPDKVEDLAARAQRAREIVVSAELPGDLVAEICAAYARLRAEYGESMSLAVRSSATAEDLPGASFAGQHETFLNIAGEASLLDAVRNCFASLFMDRAIRYRIDKGFDHFKVFQSVGVMKMVRSDRAASGVIFTLDTETGFRNAVLITGAYGLGENVVQGTVDPDEFYAFKPSLRDGHRAVLRRRLGSKEVRMVYSAGAGRSRIRNMPTSPEERARFCISDAEVLTLADAAIAIEDHYSRKAGQPTPMDIEWAKDGIDGALYIVQARPETVASRRPMGQIETFELEGRSEVRARGRAVGERIATGKVRVLSDAAHLDEFRPGEILVADTTMPDWGTVMKGAAAVVTNRGGRTCHAAIVARELGVPAIVGCGDATTRLHTGDLVTVCCAEGTEGRVYDGALAFSRVHTDLSTFVRPVTQMMVNIGNPDIAFKTSALPADGVGLARMEFIVADQIGLHPMAAAHPDRVTDLAERAEILRRASGFPSAAEHFVRELSEGVGMIAAAFHPRPVIVRMSDFKSNEYARLLGGRDFEPQEENPMIGFRGASRYTHEAYADGFALECAAMLRVRREMGLSNVKLMIPFCRRVQEAKRVLEAMASLGLRRGENGLEIYMMCEIPNNVLQADAFARLFDGFSIGSNDLTQLVLGVDRDSQTVAFDFDERDEGVKLMLRQAIEGAHRNHIHIGICGQAPSDYPEMVDFLVGLGIEALSVTPDTLLATTRAVLEFERLHRRVRPALPR